MLFKSQRWAWGAGGLISLAGITALVTIITSTSDDWASKETFCQTAAALQVGEEPLTSSEQADIMQVLVGAAHPDVRSDLEELLHRLQNHPEQLTPDDPLIVSTGQFIEANCSLNLPGITT